MPGERHLVLSDGLTVAGEAKTPVSRFLRLSRRETPVSRYLRLSRTETPFSRLLRFSRNGLLPISWTVVSVLFLMRTFLCVRRVC